MITRKFVLAALAAVVSIATCGTASAAVWEWRCQGKVGDQQLIFNRHSMAIIDGETNLGNIEKNGDKITTALEDAGTNYDTNNGNDGLVPAIEFTSHDDKKLKVMLTEKSSRRVLHRARMVACRDETTDIFRKVYSFKRDNEAAREITLQCYEYQLSTRGGRKGCD